MSVNRINALQKKLKKDNLDGLIITQFDWMEKRASLLRYLIGFSGSTGVLVVGSKRADFFTDFRYENQCKKEVKGARVHIVPGDPINALKDFQHLAPKNNRYGIDTTRLTVEMQSKFHQVWPEVLFTKGGDVIADLGWVKETIELNNIAKAVEISDKAFERMLAMLQPGVLEREAAAELEYQMLMLGSEVTAFETIVASGYRSALPHGMPSLKKIQKGDFVTFDFGATYNGYVSDITRTVVVGKASQRQKKIYNIVLRAQKAGIRKVKAGVSGKAVDDVCRKIITRAGFGKYFGHGTGHGIGYFVHIGPRLSPLSEDKLIANEVVTVEPGIYISGWGGVRIEDDVVVTRTGGRVLNQTPKNLLEL
ncbi:MAG: aminopeptidase P family protein [candidate division Zixibacteria bacterium]|nr:aminopeptidase P family protein [candidate division Zixibacteria bacterium]